MFDDLSEFNSDDVPLVFFTGNKNPNRAKVNVAPLTIIFTKPCGIAKDVQEIQEPQSYAIFLKEHIVVVHINLYVVQPGKSLVPIPANTFGN